MRHPPPMTLGVGQKVKIQFLEHDHVAYQIKGNPECSNMVADIFCLQTPFSPPPPIPGGGVNRLKFNLGSTVLEQDTLILALYWFNPGRPVST